MNITYGKYLIYLCRCAVLEETPKLWDNIDYEEFFCYCLNHKLDNTAYTALLETDALTGKAEALFAYSDFKTIQYNIEQEACREAVENALEEHGIDYLVLKGKNIAELYPSAELRKSSDVDILILDEEKMPAAAEIMKDLGFSANQSNADATHDVYVKDENIHFEIHRRLFPYDTKLYKPSKKILQRLKKDETKNHRYIMEPEDLYVFMIAHMAKHIKYSGIGIRMIMDIWVLRMKYKGLLDEAVINDRLNDFGLCEFEWNIRKLIDRWFNNAHVNDPVVDELEEFALSGGWIGSEDIMRAQTSASKVGGTSHKGIAKLKEYATVIFLPYNAMKTMYPCLKKFPFLLPFCWVIRGFRSVFLRHEQMRSVLSSVKNYDVTKGQEMNAFNKRIGL